MDEAEFDKGVEIGRMAHELAAALRLRSRSD
jgi:hypothetical protein